MGGGVDPAQLGHVAAAIGLVEQVVDAGIEQGMDAGGVEEVLLDVAEGEDRQGQRRVRAAHGGVVGVDLVAVEAEAQVGHQPLDGVAQVLAAEQVVLHHPAGEHAVPDLVAQPRIVLAQQVEEGGQQLGGGAPRRDLGIGIDDGLPQGTIRNEAHAVPSVGTPAAGANSGAAPCVGILSRCGGAPS